jgi:hypothetical protein
MVQRPSPDTRRDADLLLVPIWAVAESSSTPVHSEKKKDSEPSSPSDVILQTFITASKVRRDHRFKLNFTIKFSLKSDDELQAISIESMASALREQGLVVIVTLLSDGVQIRSFATKSDRIQFMTLRMDNADSVGLEYCKLYIKACEA